MYENIADRILYYLLVYWASLHTNKYSKIRNIYFDSFCLFDTFCLIYVLFDIK